MRRTFIKWYTCIEIDDRDICETYKKIGERNLYKRIFKTGERDHYRINNIGNRDIYKINDNILYLFLSKVIFYLVIAEGPLQTG